MIHRRTQREPQARVKKSILPRFRKDVSYELLDPVLDLDWSKRLIVSATCAFQASESLCAQQFRIDAVAPLAGAWIETVASWYDCNCNLVAPPRGGVAAKAPISSSPMSCARTTHFSIRPSKASPCSRSTRARFVPVPPARSSKSLFMTASWSAHLHASRQSSAATRSTATS